MGRITSDRPEEWLARRDARGSWVVHDRDGKEPLRSPDVMTRLTSVHLAAQAPVLADLCRCWIDLAERLDRYGYLPGQMTEQARSLVAATAITLKHVRPSVEDRREAEAGQGELDLAA